MNSEIFAPNLLFKHISGDKKRRKLLTCRENLPFELVFADPGDF
jgi:hypothetical protein